MNMHSLPHKKPHYAESKIPVPQAPSPVLLVFTALSMDYLRGGDVLGCAKVMDPSSYAIVFRWSTASGDWSFECDQRDFFGLNEDRAKEQAAAFHVLVKLSGVRL